MSFKCIDNVIRATNRQQEQGICLHASLLFVLVFVSALRHQYLSVVSGDTAVTNCPCDYT